jgi:RimJ/RimL family protein N-acetyltransferase
MIHGLDIDLRLVAEGDLEELSSLWADVEARGQFYPLGLTPWPAYRRDYEETGFWGKDYGRMVIAAKDGEILGQIAYFQPAPYLDALEIAYIILKPERRGQGVMSEALRLFCGYLFETRKMNRLQLTVVPGNVASQRVAEKAGFQREGLLRGTVFLHGRNQDMQMFALLRDEWRALSEGGKGG